MVWYNNLSNFNKNIIYIIIAIKYTQKAQISGVSLSFILLAGVKLAHKYAKLANDSNLAPIMKQYDIHDVG